jgi:hypothetical protein
MEATHKKIEEYIVANMGATGLKYSLTEHNARDFALDEAPLLIEGDDDYVVFTVNVENSGSASVGNDYRRLVGTVSIECYIGSEKSARAYYTIADKLRGFLEATAFTGIILRSFDNVNSYKVGKWNVKPSVVSFQTTTQRI